MGSGDLFRLQLVRVAYGDPDALRLVEQVQAEYVVRYGSPDETPLEPAMFDPPAGSFFVGYVEGEPVATGAWRRKEVEAFGTTRTAEIKRMYVVPAARGRGVARAVLSHLETTAAQAGAEALLLETGLKQPEAITLYESSGYVPVPAFGFYAEAELSRYYGRDLRVRSV